MSGVDWFLYLLILACGGVGLAYGVVTRKLVLAEAAGSPRMREISGAIQEGAMAYLNRQYMTIAGVGAVVFLLLWLFLGFHVGFGYLIGALLSGSTGYIGMNVSVRANVRTAEAARAGLAARPRRRLSRRRGHRAPGGGARPPRGLGLLRHPAALRPRHPLDPRGAGRPQLRRVLDLDLRPARRRHLHQGRRRRRRSGRQDRGRHPRGRPAQSRGDRRQRRRQRRRLRRHGGGPVRDLRRDRGRDHAARRDLLHRRRPRPR